MRPPTRWFPALLLTLPLALAGCPGDGAEGVAAYQPDPDLGATSFYSAAVDLGANQGWDAPTDAGGGGAVPGGERTVEEGDIFRLLPSGRLVNLNAWRGLQIIDLSDLWAPTVVGRLRLNGTPVELYVEGDLAVILLNQWQGYYGALDSSVISKHEGGVVLVVDLTEPAAPVVVDHVAVEGTIRTSRLARGGGQAALYVAAQAVPDYGAGGVGDGVSSDEATAYQEATLVRSYELVGADLQDRYGVDLGGWISDLHATAEALLVARYDWGGGQGSRVSVIDISDPGGAMSAGAEVQVAGQVASQFNMDLQGTVLRVVSGGGWGDDVNHLQTFDIGDLASPTLIDHETFGAEQDLYATLFVGDRAFFVTYLRQDPFHAFAITPEGDATEMSEFVVSGWNDFFRTASAETRLLGVGIDDAAERAVAISLYDITDLTNPTPLLDRETVALPHSASEANWDHRAFNVLEGAVAAAAPDDPAVIETGLLLVPFNGWSADGYLAGVQIFTFSDTTLTARGVMEHGSPVRRSFLAAEDAAANLSETTLALYDVSDVDAPSAAGALELAPSYSDFFVFGDYGARLEADSDYWWYWEAPQAPLWTVETVLLSEDPDTAPAQASFQVPSGSTLIQVGDLLAAVALEYAPTPEQGDAWRTDVAVWDLADPSAPQARGTLSTTELGPGWGGQPVPGGWGAADAGTYRWYGEPNAKVVGDAIVFLSSVTESGPGGTRETCVTWPMGATGGGGGGTDPGQPGGGASTPGDPDDPEPARPGPGDAYYVGSIECVSDDGAAPYCRGDIWACAGFEVACVLVDPETIETERQCKEEAFQRYWQRYVLHALDLSDPDAPTLHAPLPMGLQEEAAEVVADGATLYYNYREPYDVAGDPRPYVRYYVRAIDFTTPAAPVVGDPVNVPGCLLAVDGASLFTRDFVYNNGLVEQAISRVVLAAGVATLVARHRFGDRIVEAMLLDGAGHAVVAHRPPWSWETWTGSGGAVPPAAGGDVVAPPAAGKADGEEAVRLTVLSAETCTEQATVDVDSWAELRVAVAGRAVLQVPGGLLVMNLDEPSRPTPQAFFATAGWPREVVTRGTTLYFAGGRYGLYAFDLNAFNLWSP